MLKDFRVFHFNDSQCLWGQNQKEQWTVPHDERQKNEYNTRTRARLAGAPRISSPPILARALSPPFYLSPKFETKSQTKIF